MRKKGGLRAKLPRKLFKTTPFTLAINVINAHFGTKVALEKRRKSGEFMSYKKNSLSNFAIDESYVSARVRNVLNLASKNLGRMEWN